MFAFKNLTVSFVAKVGRFGIEFTTGVFDELALNVTGSAANAAELPKDINVKFISKNQFITGTTAVVSYKIVQTKIFDLIVGATPNLII